MTQVQPASDIDLFRTLVRCLEEFAQVADKIQEARALGDETRIRKLVEESRKRRYDLDRAQDAMRGKTPPNSEESLKLMVRTRELLGRVRVGDQIISEMFAKAMEGASNEELMKTAEGAVTIVDRMLPGRWDYETDLAVLCGDDTQKIADELIRRGQQRIIVYLTKVEDAPTYNKLASVVSTLDGITVASTHYTKPPPQSMTFFAFPKGTLTAEDIERARTAVRDTIQAMVTCVATVEHLGETWVMQGIENYTAISQYPSVAHFREKFRGRPMILVAPGPSLAKNIEMLRAAKGKAIILAFSQTLKALAKAGIEPDLVMLVDPTDLRYHFEGVDVSKIPALVIGATCFPALFEELPFKTKITYAGNTRLEDWIYEAIGENAKIPAGGTVAHSAYSLAVEWECNPIVFVGLDLSYPGGQAYIASGPDGATVLQPSSDGKRLTVQNNRHTWLPLDVVYVPGYHGAPVQTSTFYSQFLLWFEARTYQLQGKVDILNCTEGGAFIKGCSHIPLKQAIEERMKEPFDVSGEIARVTADVDRRGRATKMLAHMRAMHAAMNECIRLAHRCKQLVPKAHLKPALLDELGELEKKMLIALKPVLFVSLVRQRAIRDAIDLGGIATSVEESLQATSKLLDVILDAGALLHEPMLASERSLVATLEGLS